MNVKMVLRCYKFILGGLGTLFASLESLGRNLSKLSKSCIDNFAILQKLHDNFSGSLLETKELRKLWI